MNVFFEEYGGAVLIIVLGVAILGGLYYCFSDMIGGGIDVQSVVMRWLVS